jgi:hypothetical protein
MSCAHRLGVDSAKQIDNAANQLWVEFVGDPMNRKFLIATAVGVSFCATQQAQACIVAGGIHLGYVQLADVVVVGKIENYRKVVTYQTNSRTNKSYEIDYASFDIVIEETLRGNAGGRISVVWGNEGRLDPESLAEGSKLIALIAPASPGPDPSEDVLPRVESDLMSVIEPLCHLPFLVDVPSRDERRVREILARD